MLPFLLALAAAAGPSNQTPPGTAGATCVTEYGQTVCGYKCLARFGQVRCSQTPEGICYTEGERVVCWDPPAYYLRSTARASLPKPRCHTEYGKTACGWDCTARYGKVACAQSPDGLCVARNEQLVCWDPPLHLRAAYPADAVLPKPTCEVAYGQLACGYSCLARHGQLRCTQTPEGICREEAEAVVCWDPPI